jgi:hypothetical protein
MSLSHNIHNVSGYQYPSNPHINYRLLVESTVSHHYGEFVDRLRESGYSIPINDYYHTYLGQYTPASFVTDSRGYPVLRPGYNKRWLVFHHSEGAVHLYVGHYVVSGKDVLLLYGDGISGVSFPRDARGSLVTVAIDCEQLEKFHHAGVNFL